MRPELLPQWFHDHLGPCWCDPDRDDLFSIDCPIHGIPRSVRRSRAYQ